MDSKVMPKNYANSENVLYGVHPIVLLSDKVTFDNNIGKFSLSYITPNTQTSEVYEQTLPKNSSGNVINKENLGLGRITTSNYVEIAIPKHLFYIESISIKPNTTKSIEGCLGSCSPVANIARKEYFKGQQFIVAHIGGDVNRPFIVGVM